MARIMFFAHPKLAFSDQSFGCAAGRRGSVTLLMVLASCRFCVAICYKKGPAIVEAIRGHGIKKRRFSMHHEVTTFTRPAAWTRRFWAKVRVANGCWLWLGATNRKNGYGQLTIDGKRHLAHRLSWFLACGILPSKRHVCHDCDTPSCVNPLHLFLGSAGDNVRDSVRKGRNKRWKLNEEMVREIRRRYASGLTLKQVGAQFGIDHTMAGRIVRLESWAHV